ncbi:MAG: hypothetical protein JWL74_649, partial [Alphaproteobacteria bacterium]|nr:hypothetical protein [Alphaproteobacteria bacterium]
LDIASDEVEELKRDVAPEAVLDAIEQSTETVERQSSDERQLS